MLNRCHFTAVNVTVLLPWPQMVSYSTVLTAISKVRLIFHSRTDDDDSNVLIHRLQLSHTSCSVVRFNYAVVIFTPQFDDFSRELCVKSLLEIMDMFCHRLRYEVVSHPTVIFKLVVKGAVDSFHPLDPPLSISTPCAAATEKPRSVSGCAGPCWVWWCGCCKAVPSTVRG